MSPDPTLDKHFKQTKSSLSLFFYEKRVMPCCMNKRKYVSGHQYGPLMNITCVHCGHHFNVNLWTKFIKDIDPDTPIPGAHQP